MIQRIAFLSLLLLSPAVSAVEPIIGWRTDGTGQYPRAQPPREWALDKNVVWSTKLPAGSVASPIIVGERIFVCSEPCMLICVSKADGKILWQKENSYQELVIPEELKPKIEAERKADDELKSRQGVISAQHNVVKKMLAAGDIAKEEADKKSAELKAQLDDLEAQRKKLTLANRYREPGKNSVGGFAQCTPVCDRRQVFVGFGNGLVACYDLAGERRWLRLVEHSTAPYGQGASPVLAGGKLLVHFADLVALDLEDGTERWRTKLSPNHGTSIAVKIAGDDAIVHPTGALIRASDGKVLAEKLGSSGPNSPIVHDGIVYTFAGEGRAARLPTEFPVATKSEELWKARLKGGGYWFSSPILHEGLLYGLSAQGILNVVDAVTGKTAYEQRLDLGQGEVYPSVTLAGGLLFISSDSGVTLVLEPGREYREVSRNTLEPFRSTPVFEGKRMYVRTLKNLFCIGE